MALVVGPVKLLALQFELIYATVLIIIMYGHNFNYAGPTLVTYQNRSAGRSSTPSRSNATSSSDAPSSDGANKASPNSSYSTSRGGQHNPGTGTKRARSRASDGGDDGSDLDALVNGGGGAGRKRAVGGEGSQAGRGGAGRAGGWRPGGGEAEVKRSRSSDASTLAY